MFGLIWGSNWKDHFFHFHSYIQAELQPSVLSYLGNNDVVRVDLGAPGSDVTNSIITRKERCYANHINNIMAWFMDFVSCDNRRSLLRHLGRSLTANSQIARRAHAVPLPCRAALIHTCHAVSLPCSDSAVSFVKVRVVAGNIRTARPAV
jgi:hypothetical protein